MRRSAHKVDAADFIRQKKPHAIFADQTICGKDGRELLGLQKTALEKSDSRAFFLLTCQDSNSGVDAVIMRPFTFDSIQSSFIGAMTTKLNPTPFQKAIRIAQDLEKCGKRRSWLARIHPF